MPAGLHTASTDEVQALCARLLQFNQQATGLSFDDTALHLVWRDAHGQLRAGLLGEVCASWLNIHVLWVDPDLRGKGIGATLLAAAETQARQLGAIGAALDTFDWQAEAFYRAQGYVEFGRLHDCPPGHQRIYLQRRFAT